MPRSSSLRRLDLFADLTRIVGGKLQPPFGVVLGSPAEVAELVGVLPTSEVACFQMDLFQAQGLDKELAECGHFAEIRTAADLWDLPADFRTLIYPAPQGGERALKLDMVEQAYHVLKPHGNLIVLSPFEQDDLFPRTLKKVFGKVHSPMAGQNHVFWCGRAGDRPRRRHEVTFQVRADETSSLRFLSRPGTFSYGKFDDGARALVETMEVREGDHVLDLGCGCGTNGIFASRSAGPAGTITFVDSNLRALALADHNARSLGVPRYETVASCTLTELPARRFDVVLANPPYYAQLAIARLFIEQGRRCLKPGGRFYLVTKQVDQIFPLMEEVFGSAEAGERRGYFVFEAGL